MPFEVLAYGVVLLLGVVAGRRRKWAMTGFALVLFAVFQYWLLRPFPFLATPVLNIFMPYLLIFTSWFVAGALLYHFSAQMSHSVLMASVVAVVGAVIIGSPVLFILSGAGVIVGIGNLRFPVEAITKFGDPSYGIYIYGWIVQQTLVHFGLNRGTWWGLFIDAALFSLFVGYVSWHLVEKPAMDWIRPRKPRPGGGTRLPDVEEPQAVPAGA